MAPENQNSPEGAAPSWLWLMLALVLVVLSILVWSILRLHLFVNSDEAGKYGDYFGIVNAFFSGCAFAVLIYTLRLQRIELQLQRQELSETRQELKKQAVALAASVAPRIEISVRFDGHNSYLRIQNNGGVAAFNVAMKCDPDVTVIFRKTNGDLAECQFSSLPIALRFPNKHADEVNHTFSLDPGQTIAWLIKENLTFTVVRVDVTFQSQFEAHSIVSRSIGGGMYDCVDPEGTPSRHVFESDVINKLEQMTRALEARFGRGLL